jgi:septin family protein
MESRLQCPFAMTIAGPSMVGKSVFTQKLLENKNKIMKNPPEKVHYFYSTWSPKFLELEKFLNVTFHKGLSDLETIVEENTNIIILL